MSLRARASTRSIHPAPPASDWGDNSLLYMKTESATDLRYRDDLQVGTTNVYNAVAGGLALVPGTYHTFGNNGTTAYQGSVNSAGNTALNDLAPGAPISAAQLRPGPHHRQRSSARCGRLHHPGRSTRGRLHCRADQCPSPVDRHLHRRLHRHRHQLVLELWRWRDQQYLNHDQRRPHLHQSPAFTP